MPIISTLEGLVLSLLGEFTKPSAQIFLRLAVGWILCPARRTITGMIPYADHDGLRGHDAYHRFFRAGAWCVHNLFRAWAKLLVPSVYPRGRIWIQTDDTVHAKTGRKVEGAKLCRDAVRSTGGRTVYVWGGADRAALPARHPPLGRRAARVADQLPGLSQGGTDVVGPRGTDDQ